MNRKKLLKLESELRALEMNIEFCGDLNKERDYENDDFIEEISIPKIIPSFWEYDRTDRKRYTCYLQRMREVDKVLMRTIQKEIVKGNQKRYSSIHYVVRKV